MIIRQETPQDYHIVNRMVKLSFSTNADSDKTESDYLKSIRMKDTFIPELSLLALENGTIVGQIVLYEMSIQLRDRTLTELVISPLSVHPEYFKQGIATVLIEAGLAKALKMGYKAVFLCGDPNFYGKFGFMPTYHYGIHHIKDIHAEWCMVKELENNFLNEIAGFIDIE